MYARDELLLGSVGYLFPSLLRNWGNKHQNNNRVSAEIVRHSSTYIILYAHGFVVFCFALIISFVLESCYWYIITYQPSNTYFSIGYVSLSGVRISSELEWLDVKIKHQVDSLINAHTGNMHTVYPKKYAHGFCFAVLCCGYTLTDFPISIRLTSLALWQSDDCPSASKATLMNMDKYFIWILYERLHNHNKAKHNKTVRIRLGIYYIIRTQQLQHNYFCVECNYQLQTGSFRKKIRLHKQQLQKWYELSCFIRERLDKPVII